MLLQIRHLDTKGDHRLYHVKTPRGMDGILQLYASSDHEIDLVLSGTYYRRHYPATGKLGKDPPRIRDLEGGYQTVQTFLSCWEHATSEQREDMIGWDNVRPINWFRTDRKTGETKRTKRKVRQVEDRPVHVPARAFCDWYKVKVKDMRAALKGTLQADMIRIAHVSIKRSVLHALFGTKSALTLDPIVELKPEAEALSIRSADHSARVTIKHGAGDRAKGAWGFTRRIAFVPAS